ncbi:MAG: arsenical pump-driving ATPase [Acidiferrobacteraceae bacterium]|nr:arsenical pump-driving ATPase [Acidiferrobacteraceae bacterium]
MLRMISTDSLKTPNIFFTGKGGVGKTSTACAIAVALADQRKTVLLVSTDPASNVDEVLENEVGTSPTKIRRIENLWALNVDPDVAAEQYRERMIGPYRELLPEAAIASMEEQLAGACTVEIAAFDEFAKLLGKPDLVEKFDHVIFDTAPTGHTLRLLTLPAAWTGYIGNNTAGTSCIGPLKGMIAQQKLYARAVDVLKSDSLTTIILVARPEKTALEEAARTSEELEGAGLQEQQLVINGVFDQSANSDPLAHAFYTRGDLALQNIPNTLTKLKQNRLPLKSGQLIGINSLRGLLSDGDLPAIQPDSFAGILPPSVDTLIDKFSSLKRGLIMTMGKGGVGKTTIAAKIAKSLASQGKDVLLATTDPAAHIRQVVGEGSKYLELAEINPAVEVERYRNEVLSTTGANLDENGRALLEEDLSSPCTEEIAVFQAFAKTVETATEKIVVLDTAPTGHTILLLDAAQSFHKEVERQARMVPQHVLELLPRLRDADFTFPIICTLAEATPVHEASELQNDLRRASIHPYAWVINQSLAPLTTNHPVLSSRKNQEHRYIREVCDQYAQKSFILPWLEEPLASENSAKTENCRHIA